MPKKRMAGGLKGVLGSMKDDVRTWPWWMRSSVLTSDCVGDANDITTPLAPWEGELPSEVISLLLGHVAVCEALLDNREMQTSARVTRHFMNCEICQNELILTIEKLQYFRHLVS